MFEFLKRRRNNNCELQTQVNRLTVINADLVADTELEQERIHELEHQLETVREENTELNQRYTALDANFEESKVAEILLENQNRELKEALAHAIHAMATFQGFSDAIAQRLSMLPDRLGLSNDLAREILGDFDQDLKDREALATKIEQNGSYTITVDCNENGYLLNKVTQNEIIDAIFGATTSNELPEKWEKDVIYTILDADGENVKKMDRLGLYIIKFDLGKKVTAKAKVWLVP